MIDEIVERKRHEARRAQDIFEEALRLRSDYTHLMSESDGEIRLQLQRHNALRDPLYKRLEDLRSEGKVSATVWHQVIVPIHTSLWDRKLGADEYESLNSLPEADLVNRLKELMGHSKEFGGMSYALKKAS